MGFGVVQNVRSYHILGGSSAKISRYVIKKAVESPRSIIFQATYYWTEQSRVSTKNNKK